MTDEDFQPRKSDLTRMAEQIDRGVQDLNRERDEALAQGDTERAEWKGQAAQAAAAWSADLRDKVQNAPAGKPVDSEYFRQAEQVANAANCSGILIDGRGPAEWAAQEDNVSLYNQAGKAAWEAGEHPSQIKAARVEGSGAFTHVATDAVPFWWLAAPPKGSAAGNPAPGTFDQEGSYWGQRAAEHRTDAQEAEEKARTAIDAEEAQNWRATAADKTNLAEACERNADMYDLGLDNDIKPEVAEEAAPQTAEKYYLDKATELRIQAEELAAQAEETEDTKERADMYRQAAELEAEAVDFDNEADEETVTSYDDEAWTTQADQEREDAVWNEYDRATGKPGSAPYGTPEANAEEVEIAKHEQWSGQPSKTTIEEQEREKIDWGYVETSTGRTVQPEERNALEVEGLKAETDALVYAAERVEVEHEIAKTGIQHASRDTAANWGTVDYASPGYDTSGSERGYTYGAASSDWAATGTAGVTTPVASDTAEA